MSVTSKDVKKTEGITWRRYKDGDKEVRGYASLVAELLEKFPIGERIVGEQNQKDFIKLYGGILRV